MYEKEKRRMQQVHAPRMSNLESTGDSELLIAFSRRISARYESSGDVVDLEVLLSFVLGVSRELLPEVAVVLGVV